MYGLTRRYTGLYLVNKTQTLPQCRLINYLKQVLLQVKKILNRSCCLLQVVHRSNRVLGRV